MSDATLLVMNAGSSSIKFAVYGGGSRETLDRRIEGQIEGIGRKAQFSARDADKRTLAGPVFADDADESLILRRLLDWLAGQPLAGKPAAVGHRVVFGGPGRSAPALIDAALLSDMEGLIPLMPLHLPKNLGPIHALRALDPDLPQVACFDTAFHADLPRLARLFALPRALTDEGLLRYGFHGLSYEYIASVLPRFDRTAAEGRTVVAHLGSGASLCALDGGRSIATTMGFSALDGLVMGTRPGLLDPGVLLYLMREKGMDADAIERLLYQESGLLGVSGVSNDMRDLLASAKAEAREAVDLFCYRIAREIGSLAAALGGLDALVFTAGVGEHAAEIRADVMARCAWLGLVPDPAANESRGPRISAEESAVSAWIVPTDEDRMIAGHTLDLVAEARA